MYVAKTPRTSCNKSCNLVFPNFRSATESNERTLELEDFLSQKDIDTDRLAAFLQRKASEKPQSNRLFGNFTFDVDFEVPLIRNPTKDAAAISTPPETVSDENEPPAQANNALPSPTSDRATPPNILAPVQKDPTPPAVSPPPVLSPTHRRSLRRSGNVPGSDKLRRHAIRRRSQSCGRQLLKEFEESCKSPSSFVSTLILDHLLIIYALLSQFSFSFLAHAALLAQVGTSHHSRQASRMRETQLPY